MIKKKKGTDKGGEETGGLIESVQNRSIVQTTSSIKFGS